MTQNIKNKFSIEVTSVPDRNDLVAEIWLGQELIAELRHEHDSLQIQLYQPPDGQCWDVPYEEFAGALTQARDRLGPKPTR